MLARQVKQLEQENMHLKSMSMLNLAQEQVHTAKSVKKKPKESDQLKVTETTSPVPTIFVNQQIVSFDIHPTSKVKESRLMYEMMKKIKGAFTKSSRINSSSKK